MLIRPWSPLRSCLTLTVSDTCGYSHLQARGGNFLLFHRLANVQWPGFCYFISMSPGVASSSIKAGYDPGRISAAHRSAAQDDKARCSTCSPSIHSSIHPSIPSLHLSIDSPPTVVGLAWLPIRRRKNTPDQKHVGIQWTERQPHRHTIRQTRMHGRVKYTDEKGNGSSRSASGDSNWKLFRDWL